MKNQNKNNGCLMLFLIWIIVALVIGFILNCINETGQGIDALIIASTEISFLSIVVIFSFRMAVITSKAKKTARRKVLEDKRNGINRFDCIMHVCGLAVPANCRCSAVIDSEGFTVICSGNEFLLRISKIRNVDFQIDIDERHYLKSSLAGGIIGAAAFGVSGAVIGSAPKAKIKREVKCYAIISYEDDQGVYRTFILQDEFANLNRCAKLVDILKPLVKTQVNKVEL